MPVKGNAAACFTFPEGLFWGAVMNSRLAEQVSRLPRRFEQSNCSTAALLEEIGFLEEPDGLTVEDVEQALAQDPELADDWLERGQDQRISGGWGIECDHGQYHVRSFAGGGNFCEHDRLHATALFVVRYLGFMGDVIRRYKGRGR
jgi:hypothetical protein